MGARELRSSPGDLAPTNNQIIGTYERFGRFRILLSVTTHKVRRCGNLRPNPFSLYFFFLSAGQLNVQGIGQQEKE
jgi:hypothetical protein